MPQPDCDGVGVGLIALTVNNDLDVKQFFGIFWSLMPYAFLATLIFALFFSQRISLLILVVFGLIMTAINEFAIKKVHEESRPSQSCLDTGGFPSGHSMIATLYLTWITGEILVHPNWSIRRKIVSLIGLWVLLAPCPPFRHVGHDHSWKQIAGGVVVGFVCGLILFIFNQLVIIRYLEYIMNWRIIKFFRIRNDLRPNYERSVNKGKKAPSQTSEATPKTARVKSVNAFKFSHIIVLSLNYILGALGIILGSVKDHDSSCNKPSGTVTIGVGIWTFFAAIFGTVVFLLALRKMDKKSWYPEIVQGFVFLTGIFITEGLFWNVASIATSDDNVNCAHRNLTFVYAIVWFALEGIILVFVVEMAFLLDLRRIYGFKKTVAPGPNGKSVLADKAGDEKGTTNHDAPLEYQMGGSDRGIPTGANAV